MFPILNLVGEITEERKHNNINRSEMCVPMQHKQNVLTYTCVITLPYMDRQVEKLKYGNGSAETEVRKLNYESEKNSCLAISV